MKHYDLIVIGTGPAGEKAAVKAAYFGKSVAIVEKEKIYGGAGVVTGTLPSKTLKETALYISGKYEKGLYGVERDLQHEATIEDFLYRKNFVCSSAGKEVYDNLLRHHVDILHGMASIQDPHTVKIDSTLFTSDYILIATGSYPHHPPNIPFDGKQIHDSDTILQIEKLPSSLCIVGAGVIGCEYATIFGTLGSKVYLINEKPKILTHIDSEITQELIAQMQTNHIEILFSTVVNTLQKKGGLVELTLSSGQTIQTNMFLFAAGRNGNTRALNLEEVGIKIGKREMIEVDNQYRTSVPNIYAAGDVIGFPALASTSMDQGRIAISHMFQTHDLEHLSDIFPYGIYTIPEVSTVGITEDDSRSQGLNYCTGKARYADMSRGKIMGASSGFLKLVFDRSSLTILGVHIIGHIATELIHYGLLLVKDKKTLYNIIEDVFNYPTLHDLYKYAAYDGLGNVAGHKIKT